MRVSVTSIFPRLHPVESLVTFTPAAKFLTVISSGLCPTEKLLWIHTNYKAKWRDPVLLDPGPADDGVGVEDPLLPWTELAGLCGQLARRTSWAMKTSQKSLKMRYLRLNF